MWLYGMTALACSAMCSSGKSRSPLAASLHLKNAMLGESSWVLAVMVMMWMIVLFFFFFISDILKICVYISNISVIRLLMDSLEDFSLA